MNLPTIQLGGTRNLLVAATATCALLAPLLARSSVQPAWIAHTNGGVAQATNQVVAMALDRDGNIVIAGSSTGAAGDYDYLTLKYASDGHLLWSARYASTDNGNDQVQGMVLDEEGNVYLTGSSVTVKYRSDGSLAWTAPHAGRALAVNAMRQLYVTGFSGADFATVKLSESGTNEWVRFKDFYGLSDRAEKIVLDDEGNVFVAGTVQVQCGERPPMCFERFGIVKYAPDGSEFWLTVFPASPAATRFGSVAALVVYSSRAYISVYSDDGGFDLRRLSADGAVEWRQTFGLSQQGITALVLNKADDAAYVTGSTFFNGFPNSAYITFKVDGSGNKLWQTIYNNGNMPGYNCANAMASDNFGDIYVTGRSDNIDGNAEWATISYTSAGKEQWVRRYAGPVRGIQEATAIVVDAIGNIYVAGIQTTTNGSSEVVLIKYSELTNIALHADGTAVLQFFGAPGQSCRIHGSTNLIHWTELSSQTVDDSGVVRFEDTNAAIFPTRFYRMVSP